MSKLNRHADSVSDTLVSVYSAIKVRSEALSRPQLVVSRLTPRGGVRLPVGPGHPSQQLLD